MAEEAAGIDHNSWVLLCRNVKKRMGFEVCVDDVLAGPDGVSMVIGENGEPETLCIAGGPRMLCNFHHGMVAAQLASAPDWVMRWVERSPGWVQATVFAATGRWVARKIRICVG